MKTVRGRVYGKEYTLACDEGQEQHLQKLISQLNARTERLDKALGKLPEPMMLLYTALMVADELHEAQKEATRLRAELANAEQLAAGGDDARLEQLEEEVAGNLAELANRMENLALKLEA